MDRQVRERRERLDRDYFDKERERQERQKRGDRPSIRDRTSSSLDYDSDSPLPPKSSSVRSRGGGHTGNDRQTVIESSSSLFEKLGHRSSVSSISSGSEPGRIVLHTAPRRSSVAKNAATLKGKPAQLVYTTSHKIKIKYDLINSETKIGRKDDNDISLACVKISKFHASVIRKGDDR